MTENNLATNLDEFPALFFDMVQIDRITGKGVPVGGGVNGPTAQLFGVVIREIPCRSSFSTSNLLEEADDDLQL